jgi:hypothetical protein
LGSLSATARSESDLYWRHHITTTTTAVEIISAIGPANQPR